MWSCIRSIRRQHSCLVPPDERDEVEPICGLFCFSPCLRVSVVDFHSSGAPMIVMKFGGTSVQDAQAIDRVAAIVRERLDERPVVVVSALAKITDQLLAMASAAGAGNREKALELSRAARERHYNCASDLLGTHAFEQIAPELEADFDGLDELLRGVVAVGELTPRTTDNISGFGERVSSKIAAAAFSRRNIEAAHVDSRRCIVTDSNFGKAVPQFEETDERLKEVVKPLLERKCVPVMGGFIAATREGVSTTLGRGGSDFSAAIVGAGLNAERIEIWTDVDGMMTTDPAFAPTPSASSASALKKRPSWLTSARRSCTLPRCCRPSRRTFPC